MDREIKFRMWRDGRMQGVHTMYSRDSGADHPVSPSNFALSEDEILMQFTGLKDKNGVEIYEGDRIRYENSLEQGEGVVSFNLGFVIEWDLATVKTDKPSVISPLFYFGCSSEIEIIGNIYDA